LPDDVAKKIKADAKMQQGRWSKDASMRLSLSTVHGTIFNNVFYLDQ
jgi:hypothetical protein